MDVRMPDGTIVKNVPEGATQKEVMDLYHSQESGSDQTDNSCPPATGNIALNLKNRQKAINTAHYGPLNPNLPNRTYWSQIASIWSVTAEEAKKSRCGNCAAFNQTNKILDCIDQGLAAGGSGGQDAWDTIMAGDLGYCEAFDFKCASSRVCSAWIVGGPIKD